MKPLSSWHRCHNIISKFPLPLSKLLKRLPIKPTNSQKSQGIDRILIGLWTLAVYQSILRCIYKRKTHSKRPIFEANVYTAIQFHILDVIPKFDTPLRLDKCLLQLRSLYSSWRPSLTIKVYTHQNPPPTNSDKVIQSSWFEVNSRLLALVTQVSTKTWVFIYTRGLTSFVSKRLLLFQLHS